MHLANRDDRIARSASKGFFFTLACAAGCPLWLLAAPAARAQAPAAPPGAGEPVLRVDAGGPTAFVTALVFSPDGKALYAAGFDKVVRVWTLDARTGRFVPSSTAYRVPVGPGLGGVINALAVSPDGTWLAAAGSGAVRGAAGFRDSGWIVPKAGGMTREMWRDQGTIYLFNTKTGAARALRGHEGPVLSLAFASGEGGGPLLASAARERGADSKYAGAVRLWNLSKKADEAGRGGVTPPLLSPLPDPVDEEKNWVTRPGLALWHPDNRPEQARVAIAWEDGKLRLWDVAGEAVAGAWPDGAYNDTVLYLPGQRRLLTTSFRNPRGHVQGWSVMPGRAPASDLARGARLGEGHFPRAMALFSAKANGSPDHAAVVVRVPGRGEEFGLQIIDLRTFRLLSNRPLLLWKNTVDEPVIAASPRGRYVAVAGNPDHTILVFSTADLLAKKERAKPSQELRSAGVAMRFVEFVRKGKDIGLLLSEKPAQTPGGPARAPRAGDHVFDFTGRTLTEDLKGWAADAPDRAGWEAERRKEEVEGREVTVFRVKKDGRPAGKVVLQPGQDSRGCDFALLPPGKGGGWPPLLAAGFVEKGEAMLCLYNAESGEQVRQLTGHVNRVRSLAFSGDGRLLASAADDQTVSVWGLTDLDRVLGKQGVMPGLAVEENDKGKGLVLAELDPRRLAPANREALARKGVREGDVIEGFVSGGKVQPLASPQAFYRTVWEAPPGAKLTLRAGGRDVQLIVGQGIDERKPLLSLFVTTDSERRAREWVGWNPAGPYDSSGRAAERHIGWHQNTGDANNPVRFSLADQYRKDYYRPGILLDLVQRGNPGEAIDAWERRHKDPPAEPQMTLGVREGALAVVPDERNRFPVRRRRVTLTLALDGLPAGKVRSLEWDTKGANGKFVAAGDGAWEADLSKYAWKRGVYTFRVVLRTEGPPAPREYTRDLTLSYRPPAPSVEAVGQHPLVVAKAEYALKARVVPGEGQTVKVTLLHRHAGKDKVVKVWEQVRERVTIEETLRLAPGVSLVKLVAENRDAPRGTDSERDWLAVEVSYKAPRPQILLRSLVLADGTEKRIDPATPDEPIIVDVPMFRVTGAVESAEPLTRAEWGAGKRLAGFDPKKKLKKLAIDQEVSVPGPGKRKVRFLALAVGGEKPEERYVTVDYQPRLPELRVTSPAHQLPLYQGESPLKVPLKAQIVWPADAHPCKAQVLVNGKKQGEPLPVAAGDNALSGEVLLEPGENRVEVHLGNDWREAPSVTRVVVPYRRPPRIVEIKELGRHDKPPRAEIRARVLSPSDLKPTRAVFISSKGKGAGLTRSSVRYREVRPEEMKAEKKGEEDTTWLIHVKDVPLEEGENQVRLVVSNADGECREPQSLKVEYEKPPLPKPEVTFLAPGGDVLVVTSPKQQVRFLVRSQSELTKVQLERDEEVLFSLTGPELAKRQKKDGETFTVEVEHDVTLVRGTNRIYAVTANAGGEIVTKPKLITYQPQPVVRLRIDSIVADGKTFTPARETLADGEVVFDEVLPSGRAVLHGHVSWDKEDDAHAAALSSLRVYVNGRQRLPAVLDPLERGSHRRTFKTEVLLTRQKGNRVALGLPPADPPLVLEAGSHRECLVGCAKPVEPRRQLAHLLVIDVTGNDRKAVLRRALDAIQGGEPRGDRFELPYCTDGGRLYGPLVGKEVTREAVYGQLLLIQRHLRLRAEAGAANDIVMLYYRGEHLTRGNEHFLQTGTGQRAADPRWWAIPCDRLASVFRQSPGTHLLWLDVTRSAKGAAAGAVRGTDPLVNSDAPNVAMFRFEFRGEPEDQKEDARLLANLARVMPRVVTLEQLGNGLSKGFDKSGEERPPYPSEHYKERLLYDQRVPEGLRAMALGGPRP